MSIITVEKMVTTDITDIEAFIFKNAFEIFEPKYIKKVREFSYYKKRYGKKAMTHYVKDDGLPKMGTFNYLKEYFDALHTTIYSRTNPQKHTSRDIRVDVNETVIILDVLECYLEIGKFDEMYEGWDRKRKSDFIFHIYKKDVEELIKGFETILIALKEWRVKEIEYIP